MKSTTYIIICMDKRVANDPYSGIPYTRIDYYTDEKSVYIYYDFRLFAIMCDIYIALGSTITCSVYTVILYTLYTCLPGTTLCCCNLLNNSTLIAYCSTSIYVCVALTLYYVSRTHTCIIYKA